MLESTRRIIFAIALLSLSFSLPGMALASPEACIASVRPGKPVTPAILKICQEAFEEGADGPDFLYAYGRALVDGGDRQTASRVFEWAVQDGSAQAREALAALGEPIPEAPEAGTMDGHDASPLPPDRAFAAFADEAGESPAEVVRKIASTFSTLAYPALVQPRERLLQTREGSRPEKALLLRDVFALRFPDVPVRFSACPAAGGTPIPLASRPARLLSRYLPDLLAGNTLAPAMRGQVEAFAERWTADSERAIRELAALREDLSRLPDAKQDVKRFGSGPVHFGYRAGATWIDFDLGTGGPVDAGNCPHPEELGALRTRMMVRLVATDKGGRETILWKQDVGFSGGMLFGFAEPTGLKPPEMKTPKGSVTYTPFLYTSEGSIRFGAPVSLPESPSMLRDTGDAMAGTTSSVIDAFGSARDTTGDIWQAMRFEVSLSGPGTEPDISRFDLFSRAVQPTGALEPLPESIGMHAPFLRLFSVTPVIGAALPYLDVEGHPQQDRTLLVLRDIGSALDVLRKAAFAELSQGLPPVDQTVGYFVLAWNLAGSGGSVKASVMGHLVRGLEISSDPAAWAVASATAEGALVGAQDAGATAVSRWQAERAAGSRTLVVGTVAALAPLGIARGPEARAMARLASGETLLASEGALLRKDTRNAVWWAVSPDRLVIEDEDLSGYRPTISERLMELVQIACRTVTSYKRLSKVAVAAAVVATSAATISGTLDGPMGGMEAALEWSQGASEEGMKQGKEAAEGAAAVGAACVAAGGPPE